MIQIGGPDFSNYFSDVAMKQKTREKFADSAIKFMKDHGFDGIDIDWQFPVQGGNRNVKHDPKDKTNFAFMLTVLSDKLKVIK